MKKQPFYLSTLLFSAVLISGCAQNQTRIGEGAGMGGLLGAAAGGIIGHQSGHGWQGAMIGGAAGAAGGALVGSQIRKPETATATTTTSSSTTGVNSVKIQQIVDWTKQGMSSDEIIAKIKAAPPA